MNPLTPPCLSMRDVRYAVGSGTSDAMGSGTSGVREILRGVDLLAHPGEVTVLLGPNGAGKTTTLSCAQGLVKPSQGTVRLLGQEPFRCGAELRARVGVMLQDGGLPQSVRPRTLLRHVARLHRDPWPVDDLIDRLDMGSFVDTAPRRLSGGQRQRVALAASLVGNPEVVFLDEPSAGLDVQSRQTVFDLVDELRRRGLGIVLTTHLLEEAQRLADAVHILKDGRVVRSGTVAELTEDEHGRRLIFVAPRTLTTQELDCAPTPLTHEGGNRPGARWSVDDVATPEDLSAIARWWEQIGMMPGEVSFESRSLEDVFWEVSSS